MLDKSEVQTFGAADVHPYDLALVEEYGKVYARAGGQAATVRSLGRWVTGEAYCSTDEVIERSLQARAPPFG